MAMAATRTTISYRMDSLARSNHQMHSQLFQQINIPTGDVDRFYLRLALAMESFGKSLSRIDGKGVAYLVATAK